MGKQLYSGLFILLMVASFVVPVNIAAPSAVSADPGIMKWDTVSTPMSVSGKNDILNEKDVTIGNFNGMGSSINGMAAGNDGMTIAFIDRTWFDRVSAGVVTAVAPTSTTVGVNNNPAAEWALYPNGGYFTGLYYSTNSGIAATITRDLALVRSPNFPGGANLFQVAIAPDDPKVMAVTSDVGSVGAVAAGTGPVNIWYSSDGGNNWDLAFAGYDFATATYTLGAGTTIRCLDISIDYGGKRDIGFGTVTAAGTGAWYVRSSTGFTTWNQQLSPWSGLAAIDTGIYALKFSPTYSGDSAVALVYSVPAATYFNVAMRDLNMNTTTAYAYTFPGIVVANPTAPVVATNAVLRNVSLQLPSDFSGQSASLRRAYISLDVIPGGGFNQGIYRVDDTTVYTLMDNTAVADKQIYTIAYFGTYASGKLLAGERMGFSCSATVPTWFTDSPTTCPIPCWYPALKPTTGAANIACAVAKTGEGAAIVAWNADGSLGYAATGSQPAEAFGTPWYLQQYAIPVVNDESAFAISRNNGETWNQLVLINTTIDWFNDVAVAPDCTTIYLASSNTNLGLTTCNSFDSVWRATINPNVAAPLPAVPPLGTYWERVYARPTSLMTCPPGPQSDLPILRVVPSCTDKPDGEIVGWAAQNTRAMAWSPDYGDYWATVTPRFAIQDFAFETSTTMYTVNGSGMVQRLPYTGTAWSTNLPTYQSNLETTHTIVAVPDGKVLVGAGAVSSYPVAYSADKGVSFTSGSESISGHGREHVIFDVDFKNNSFIYVGDDALAATGMGTVYRNTAPSFQRWVDNDMMSIDNNPTGIAWPVGTIGPPHITGVFGLAQAWTGSPDPAVYAAHDNVTTSVFADNSAVCRTLAPRDGMPKPGITWDCLDIFAPITTAGVKFTLEPTSLKYCGCCTLDTNTTLYAIDDESGNWQYIAGLRNNYLATRLLGRMWNFPQYIAAADLTGFGYAPTIRRGMLWAYTDCLAKRGPILKSPADGFLVGADPVTGRNQQVDLAWEQLCLATGYLIQIAKDEDFTLKIDPTLNNATTIGSVIDEIQIDMDATNMTSPAVWIAPGALPEAGAIYYWHVCVYRSATGQLAYSDWSETRSFTVKAGFIVNTPYYGVQLLAPNNGCLGCKVKPASFSWSPWKEATKYQFDLAKDPEFKSLVVTAATTTTGYEYDGTLDYSTNYFWRVKALEVNGRNIPSDWSATFSMQTEAAPEPPAPAPSEPATPLWVWVIIAIGAIFVITVLILVMRVRSK
ncbi:MAG: hypothetical protein WC359_09335 [Dehalococcoidia bacterium]|jgi:hypothetical protein